jgi:AraC-like DNA-binding protein/quercetin dioxygenase-like cupin family protein
MMRIKKATAMSGKWRDIDNVFTYIAQGCAEFVVDGNKYVCDVGDVIIIPPYKTHIVRSLGNDPLVQLIFHFDFFERPDSLLLKHQNVQESEENITISKQETILNGQVIIAPGVSGKRYERKRLYLSMYKEFNDTKEARSIMLKAYSTLLLITTLRDNLKGEETSTLKDQDITKSKSWMHIENAIAFIEAHYDYDNLSNAVISNAIGVTPNYLTRVFGDFLGISLHKYILNVKIEKAQQVLTIGKVNITEAAEITGFNSIHAFSKIFKTVVGMTPSEYLNYVAQKETILR